MHIVDSGIWNLRLAFKMSANVKRQVTMLMQLAETYCEVIEENKTLLLFMIDKVLTQNATLCYNVVLFSNEHFIFII